MLEEDVKLNEEAFSYIIDNFGETLKELAQREKADCEIEPSEKDGTP
ncbi:hypothetical protein [Sporosarcina sp. FSL K6-5500]